MSSYVFSDIGLWDLSNPQALGRAIELINCDNEGEICLDFKYCLLTYDLACIIDAIFAKWKDDDREKKLVIIIDYAVIAEYNFYAFLFSKSRIINFNEISSKGKESIESTIQGLVLDVFRAKIEFQRVCYGQ